MRKDNDDVKRICELFFDPSWDRILLISPNKLSLYLGTFYTNNP